MTSSSIFRKSGFSAKESGVGGSLVVVPIARLGFVGSVGRSDSMWLWLEDFPSGNTYC